MTQFAVGDKVEVVGQECTHGTISEVKSGWVVVQFPATEAVPEWANTRPFTNEQVKKVE